MPASESTSHSLSVVGDSGLHRRSEAVTLGSAANWTLKVTGVVDRPAVLSLRELFQLPVHEANVDVKCVSSGRIGRAANGNVCNTARFAGVTVRDLCDFVGVRDSVQTVRFVSKAPGGCGPVSELHDTTISYDHCRSGKNVLLTGCMNGQPLSYRNGGPLRSVAQELFFYKSVKWLTEIEFLSTPITDHRGTWERHAGYHNIANISRDERIEPFCATVLDDGNLQPGSDPAAAFHECLTRKDLSRLVAAQLHESVPDLSSLLASSHSELKFKDQRDERTGGFQFAFAIRGTKFRAADFAGCNLSHVNFSLCEFINIDFTNADLSCCDFEGATFVNCDLASATMAAVCLCGVRFHGCNLSNVDATDASISGAEFFKESGGAPSTVTGCNLTGATGVSSHLAAWLTSAGAVGARPNVSVGSGEFLPYCEVRMHCPPSDAERVVTMLRELDVPFGHMGRYASVTSCSATGQASFVPTDGAAPKVGTTGEISRDNQVEIVTWFPLEYRQRVEQQVPEALIALGYYEHPLVTIAESPVTLYVP